MDPIVEKCAGLDVHQRTVVACDEVLSVVAGRSISRPNKPPT